MQNETVQLKQCLEDERRKNREKDDKLGQLQKRVKNLECQHLIASKYHAASAQAQQDYADEMQIKDDKIEMLEQRLLILEEDNQRFQSRVEELEGKTKDAEAHIRYTQLKNHIAHLEKSIKEMKARRKLLQEQLSNGGSDQEEILYDEISTITEQVKRKDSQLAKLRGDLANMPNPADLAGDLGAHSRSGSYDAQYDLMPDLATDISSLASGSPPQSESIDSMDGYLIGETYQVKQSRPDAVPWARTVDPSKNLLPRATDRFATPAGKNKRGTCR